MTSLNNINDRENNLVPVLAAEGVRFSSDETSQRKLGEELLKESLKFTNDSLSQREKAQEYLQAADSLEKMANSVREKAQNVNKTNDLKEDESIKEAQAMVGEYLQMPVPKNATKEQLENLAKDLDRKAKENRRMADDLLKDAEEKDGFAKKLKEQAITVSKKDVNFNEHRMKYVQAHAEGLTMVYKKLGIFNVDMQYKEQLAYAQKKAEGRM